MAIGQFIKDNLALVAGIAVPVVLVTGFLLMSQLGRTFTDPPRHTAYFVIENDDQKNDAGIDLHVNKDGRITADVHPAKPEENGYRPSTRAEILLAYDAASGTATETAVTVPDGQGKGVYMPAEFKNLRLTTSRTAPDGYEVVYGRNHGGLVFDIFISNGADGYRIKKGAAVYRLPDSGTDTAYRYYNPRRAARFLGWSTGATP